jgi:hypothetical protein
MQAVLSVLASASGKGIRCRIRMALGLQPGGGLGASESTVSWEVGDPIAGFGTVQ